MKYSKLRVALIPVAVLGLAVPLHGCDDPAEHSIERFADRPAGEAGSVNGKESRAPQEWLVAEARAMQSMRESLGRKIDLDDALEALSGYLKAVRSLPTSSLSVELARALAEYVDRVALFRDYLADTPEWRDTWGGQGVWVLEDTVGSLHVWVKWLPFAAVFEFTTEGDRLREGYEARLLEVRECWARVESIVATPQ